MMALFKRLSLFLSERKKGRVTERREEGGKGEGERERERKRKRARERSSALQVREGPKQSKDPGFFWVSHRCRSLRT